MEKNKVIKQKGNAKPILYYKADTLPNIAQSADRIASALEKLVGLVDVLATDISEIKAILDERSSR